MTNRWNAVMLTALITLASASPFPVAAAAPEQPVPTNNRCSPDAKPFTQPFAQPHWSGWGVDLAQSRFQTAQMAQLPADQVPNLKLKWAFGFPGVDRAYGQPAVVGGRVFVGSAGGKVYSLDARSGCEYWAFDADFPVRTAISFGQYRKGWAAYFGDQHATLYALDALTGGLLWKTALEKHPAAVITGAPTLAGGRLYVPMSSYEELMGADPHYQCCKFRGSVSAVDAVTGKILWKSYTISGKLLQARKNKLGVQLWGPSGAAVWSSPTIDSKKQLLYVSTGNDYSDPSSTTSDAILAFMLKSGKLVWSHQMTAHDARTVDCDLPVSMQTNCAPEHGPDFDFGSSPILVELAHGRRALIAGQKSGMVYALDPDRHGAQLWERRVGKGGSLGGVQWGPAADLKYAYVAVSDVQVNVVPAGTPGSQANPAGVSFELDPKVGGGLFALDPQTGRVIWNTAHPGCNERPGCSPAQSAAVTAIPGVVFSGGLDGHLRAYSTQSGKIVWDVDTERDYQTVNAVKANGGSIDGPGAVIVGSMLFVNSGYAFFGSAPGNVLLAFSVDGR